MLLVYKAAHLMIQQLLLINSEHLAGGLAVTAWMRMIPCSIGPAMGAAGKGAATAPLCMDFLSPSRRSWDPSS